MYNIKVTQDFQKQVGKVRNKQSQENIAQKMEEIAETVETNPHHYKNLKKPLQKYKRAHVNNSFVLLFRVDIKKGTVIFFDYSHHDSIYKKK